MSLSLSCGVTFGSQLDSVPLGLILCVNTKACRLLNTLIIPCSLDSLFLTLLILQEHRFTCPYR